MRLKHLTIALAAAAIPVLGHSEDLLEAYQQALLNNPTLAQANAEYLATRESIAQARGALLPQISGTGSFSQTNGQSYSLSSEVPVYAVVPTSNGGTALVRDYGAQSQTANGGTTGHTRSMSWTASASQVLIDFAKFGQVRVAHANTAAQQQTYEAALQTLAYNVAEAYLTILTDQEQLSYAQANATALKGEYDQAQAQLDAGLTAIQSMLQAKAAYQQAQSTVYVDQATLADDREAMTQLTGKPTGTLQRLRDDMPLQPPQPASESQWVQRALNSNPTLLSSQYTVQADEHSIDVARAGHLPTLNASASYNKGNSWYQHGGSASTTSGQGDTVIGVSLSIPIFSGGTIQSEVREAIYNRDAALDAAEVERRTVTRNTLNYYRQIMAGINTVESDRLAVESGLKSRDATVAGYTAGTENMIDVLNAQETLFSAQSSYAAARHQFVLYRLALKQAAGVLGLSDLTEVNSLLTTAPLNLQQSATPNP
ncbi:TolC family outer membrane protein [Frateuria aurantia]